MSVSLHSRKPLRSPVLKQRLVRLIASLLLLGSILGWLLPSPLYAQRIVTADSVVRAVLFYSPTCPHCHEVIQNDLPPLIEKYGERLDIIGVDVTQDSGQALYQAAIRIFSIPAERLGVPALIVGDRVLVGSQEIPEVFPGLIEQHLAAGGVDWPAIPELQQMMAAQETQTQSASAPESPPADVTAADKQPSLTATEEVQAVTEIGSPSWQERFMQDPAGNSLALVVLVGMVVGLVVVLRPYMQRRGRPAPIPAQSGWLIPVLALAGLGVAAYLAYIETSLTPAVCGPVGDCNAVQQSEYARLFGIPIAFYGLAGYVAILALWLTQRLARIPLVRLAPTGIFAIAVVGILFSIYLTFLEPFVIGATCIWCLTSALLMTGILLFSAEAGRLSQPKKTRA